MGDDRQPQPRRRSPAVPAAQYFVGDFDGTRFTADNAKGDTRRRPVTSSPTSRAPTTAAGRRPARRSEAGRHTAALPGQQTVSGFQGNGLVNSFLDFDSSQGTLTSPPFTIGRDYLNFLVGGGAHAHDPATGDGPPPAGDVLADFEGADLRRGWTATGTFAGHAAAPPATIGDQQSVERLRGHASWSTRSSTATTAPGTISSPEFTITSDYINFLVGGRQPPYPGDAANRPTAVNLIVDGQVVRTATGRTARRSTGPPGTSRSSRARRRTSRSSTEHRRLGPHPRRPVRPPTTQPAFRARSRRRSTCSSTARSCGPRPGRTARRSTGRAGTSAT